MEGGTANRLAGSVIGALVFCAASGGCTALRMADVSARELDSTLRAEKPKGIQSLDLAMLGRPEVTDERLEAGDVLDINISDLLQEFQNYGVVARVSGDGTVSLPMVGSVPVHNLTVPQAEQQISGAFLAKGILRNPRVIVNVKERHPNRVYIIGGVKSPGVYQLAKGESDLLAAIIAAGGLSEDAGTVVEIRRRGPAGSIVTASARTATPGVLAASQSERDRNQKVDPWTGPRGTSSPVRQAAATQQTRPAVPGAGPSLARGMQILRYELASKDTVQPFAEGIAVQNGDIVVVQRHKQSSVYVLGSVRSPGVYRLPLDRELRVLEAIGEAGGVNMNTTPDKALVIRHHPDCDAVTLVKVDLDRAKKDLEENMLLMPGDTVSVEETFPSFMRGLVRNAFRVGVGVGAQYNALGPPGATGY